MTETVEQKLSRYESVIGLQMEEIDRLRAVVAKLTGTDDAHSTLRRLYLDEAQNPNTRVRAAQAALNVEKPSLKPQVAPAIDATAEEIIPLADLVRRRRARQAALEGVPLGDPRYLDWIDRDHTDEPPSPGSGQRRLGNDSGSSD
jgi:hypothetical protein